MTGTDPVAASLFSEGPRTDREPSRHDEPLYEFLDRVDRPWYDGVRSSLEAWAQRLPPAARRRLIARFRSRRDRDFYSAYFELYMFRLFDELDLTPALDPPIADTGRQADLLVSLATSSLLVEATVCFTDDTDSPEARRTAAAYAALDRTDSPNFFLWISHRQGAGPMPSLSRVRSRLELWLRTLDPDAIDVAARGDLPSLEVEAGSWSFRFEAIPKSPSARGEPGIRPLGVFDSGGARILTTKAQIRASLIEKADQTRGADLPVVIALDVLGRFPDDKDLFDSLYGDVALTFTLGTNGVESTAPTRQLTGFWTEGRLGRRRHVSGILTVVNLGPWNPHLVEPVVWMNPWADSPSELLSGLPFRRVTIDLATGTRRDIPAHRTARDVLSLPGDWPAPGGPWDD